MINMVVAAAQNGTIGINNDLPWHISSDLKHFKQLTTGKPVIMGTNTYNSIYNRLKGPLPNRRNIVVSRQSTSLPAGFELAHSINEALALLGGSDASLIGGAQLFKSFLDQDLIDRIYLTEVKADVKGDVYLPPLKQSDWQEVDRQPQRDGQWQYDFVTLERKQ
nr:Dihydrofolate reductase [uncultured bacterium]